MQACRRAISWNTLREIRKAICRPAHSHGAAGTNLNSALTVSTSHSSSPKRVPVPHACDARTNPGRCVSVLNIRSATARPTHSQSLIGVAADWHVLSPLLLTHPCNEGLRRPANKPYAPPLFLHLSPSTLTPTDLRHAL